MTTKVPCSVKVHTYRQKFRRGLNFFVSLDMELARRLEVGSFFDLEGWDGVAQVVRIYKTTLGCLPDEVYECHHDPACRSYQGLRAVIKEVWKGQFETNSLEDDSMVGVAVGFYLYKQYK